MLELGTRRGGASVRLTDLERTRHVHIIGAIGSGKSKLLEHLIRQDIQARRGLCLIDPKGSLADEIEKWCASRGMAQTRRIHIVKPGDGAWSAGFNPLRLDRGELPNVRVNAAVAACAQVWGGESLEETPRLKKILRAVFFALSVRELTIAEAPFLLNAKDPDGTRAKLTEGLPDSAFQFIWDELNSLSRREFTEYAESTVSRLSEFLTSPAVRLMIGQRAAAIDFKKVMDDGDIVIVNLGGRAGFSQAEARVVGTLITNDLFHVARTRDERTAARRPFTLYVDEAHDYLSSDVSRMLDLTRSLGLHAVLAHQRIGQLKRAGEDVYNAVMASTRTKIVFGGLDDESGEIMTRELLRDEIDLQEAKPILDRQVVVGQEVSWLNSDSWSDTESESESTSDSTSWGETSTAGTSAGESFREQDGEDPELSGSYTTDSTSQSTTQGGSRSEARNRGRSHSESHSQQEALRNVMGLAQTPYTLEEQLHRGIVKLRTLPDRYAIVKRSGRRSVRIKTRDVDPPLCTPAMVERFRTRVSTTSPYVATLDSAEAEIATRRALLTPVDPGDSEAAKDDSQFYTT